MKRLTSQSVYTIISLCLLAAPFGVFYDFKLLWHMLVLRRSRRDSILTASMCVPKALKKIIMLDLWTCWGIGRIFYMAKKNIEHFWRHTCVWCRKNANPRQKGQTVSHTFPKTRTEFEAKKKKRMVRKVISNQCILSF